MPHPLLEGTNLSKSYGKQIVLERLSFLISEGQKIALIGRNGAGKSTLLRILTRQEEQDEGDIRQFDRTRLGVVHQHEVLPSHQTTLAFLQERSGKEAWQVQKQAAQFGIGKKELALAPSELSGGYQMRVKLIAMLLEEPNLLLLDEPVNYLDLQTLILLEQFLQSYKGSYVIAAHDRTFLQHTCTTTFEIERGSLVVYKGTVSEYLDDKAQQQEYKRRTNKRLKAEIAHTQIFVDRFRYKASLASRAQSKLKHIERLKKDIAHIDDVLATTRILLSSPTIPNGVALRVDDLRIGYSQKEVAKNISFEVMRGEHIVIAGENGNGKTTLLKTLAGLIHPLEGKIKWWPKSTIGYYDQKTEATITSGETVLQYLVRMAPTQTSDETILRMAGSFLFRGDDLEKTVDVLSGGERARLCLAGVLLHQYNVLLLDEPTNHLDVETSEALAAALKQYTGTIIFISHARTFVDALADRIYEIHHGSFRQFMGSYEQYVDGLVQDAMLSLQDSFDARTSSVTSADRANEHRLIREAQRAQERIMKEITKLESEKSELLAFFFEHPTDYSPHRSQRLAELQPQIEEKEADWLLQQEVIDTLRKEQTTSQ